MLLHETQTRFDLSDLLFSFHEQAGRIKFKDALGTGVGCQFSWGSCWGPWQGWFMGSVFFFTQVPTFNFPPACSWAMWQYIKRSKAVAVKKTVSYPYLWWWVSAGGADLVLHARILFSSMTVLTSPLTSASQRQFLKHAEVQGRIFSFLHIPKLSFTKPEVFMSEGCDCSMTQLSGISQNLACQDLGFLRL